VNATAPAVNATGNASGWTFHWPSFNLPNIPANWIGIFIVVGIVLFGMLVYGLIRFGLQTVY
jgi:hypothetical protein